MIRYGTVTSIFSDKGTVKVTFEDLDIPSAEIPVLQGRTEKTKHYSMPKIGESGICIFPENSFSGFYFELQDRFHTSLQSSLYSRSLYFRRNSKRIHKCTSMYMKDRIFLYHLYSFPVCMIETLPANYH